MKFIIEEDQTILHTKFYAVEAESLEEALGKVRVGEVSAYDETDFPVEEYEYTDSHEAAEAEWADATGE